MQTLHYQCSTIEISSTRVLGQCSAAGDFVKRFRDGVPMVEFSLCHAQLAALNSESAAPEDTYRIFAEHKVTAEAFAQRGGEVMADDDLAVRLGERVYKHRDAAPFMAAAMAFGLEDAQAHAALLPDRFFRVAKPRVRGPLFFFFFFFSCLFEMLKSAGSVPARVAHSVKAMWRACTAVPGGSDCRPNTIRAGSDCADAPQTGED